MENQGVFLLYSSYKAPVKGPGSGVLVPPENSIGVDFHEHRRRDFAIEIGWQARIAGSKPGSCHGGPGRATKHANPMPFKSG